MSKAKQLILTIFIITLAIFYAVFGMGYLKQLEQREGLNSQIAEASQTLAEMPKPPEDLAEQLALAQEQHTEAQNSFPDKVSTTQLINTILAVARNCGVSATPVATQPWTLVTVGEHKYPVLRLTLAVDGNFSQLLTFASQLEEAGYPTLLIDSLTVTRSSETSKEGVTPVSGSLKLVFYARVQNPEE